jgi:site-specific recombinase XerD
VLEFLASLETRRGNSVTTRNHRLAAIRSFFRFVSGGSPEFVEQCARILAIPLKRSDSRTIDYLTIDEMKATLREIQVDAAEGRRDDALLRFLYNTGARVQEALDVNACDLKLDSPPHVLLRGKGRKERLCPLWPDTVHRLRRLLAERGLGADDPSPVFAGRSGRALTRFGVGYILDKYVQRAACRCPGLGRKRIHPHSVRHTTAMHLLQSGVDLNTIRCWLGHASVTTTNRYVEIDLEMKRRALDRVTPPGRKAKPAIPDAELITWLEAL